MPSILSSWKAAGLLVLVLTLWMLSGLLSGENSASRDDTTADNALMAVEISIANPERMARELELQGQLDPLRRVQVRAQTSGKVEQIFIRKGVRVAAQAPLVKLDNDGRDSRLAEARAAVNSALSEQQAAQALQRQRLQSRVQLDQANAALEAANARLASVELDIEKTTIKAPFPGVINDLPVELGTLVENGDMIAELVDDSAFKVSARVSQQALAQLKPGKPVSVSLITGQTLQGTVSFIASVADPQTRSFAVEAVVQNSDSAIAAGISATMTIPLEEVEAVFLTPSVLSLGVDGTLGVKALDDQDQVMFLPIELVSTTIDGAWVTGIPAQTRLVTLGQGFVNIGEKVRATLADSDS